MFDALVSVKDLLPPLYDDVRETDELATAEDSVLEEFNSRINYVYDSSSIVTAGADVVSWWESRLGIRSKVTDTIEDRRNKVMLRMSAGGLFTITDMMRLFDEYIGKDYWGFNIWYFDCDVDIWVDINKSNVAKEVLETVRRRIPMNMSMRVSYQYGMYRSAENSASYSTYIWNYKLGSWVLKEGVPFVSYGEGSQIVGIPMYTTTGVSVVMNSIVNAIKTVRVLNERDTVTHLLDVEDVYLLAVPQPDGSGSVQCRVNLEPADVGGYVSRVELLDITNQVLVDTTFNLIVNDDTELRIELNF